MDIIQALVLALVQGLTEFLPISSSAHLILPSKLLGWPDQGLAFDVSVHVGTLLAVMIYFRSTLIEMTQGLLLSLQQRQWNSDAQLAMAVVVGVIPAGLAGVLFDNVIETHLRSVAVIAATTIGFGLLLGYADKRCPEPTAQAGAHQPDQTPLSLSIKTALLIGVAQAFALIPGTSRSGVTITAALLLGLSREHAARFSFLLSIPLILAAGSLKTLQLVEQSQPVDWGMLLIGALVAGVSAYACIHWFLKLLNQIGMMPFVYYRLALGGVLLFLI